MASVRSRRDPTTVGAYAILERLGTGGAGSVYKARHARTGEVVAVKILTAALADNPRLHYRFVQEFQSAMKLDHPNIVRAIEQGLGDGKAFLVMEYVEGCDLSGLIMRDGPLPEAHAVRLVTQVAQALTYAHRQRIVHRDVKPDNIMVRADGMAKLADFGLAKDYNDDKDFTRPASGLGTVHYMAPEQFEDAKNASAACDVYSLGATLYAAVTGRVPFAGVLPHVALTKKLRAELQPVRELMPHISREVEAAIQAAIHPDPAKRPANCLRFARMLPASTMPRGRFRPDATPAPRPPLDRRGCVRYDCNIGTECKVDVSATPGSDAAYEDWPATIQDISLGGIGLALARRFEPGTVLTVEVDGGSDHPPRTLHVRVVRVRAVPPGHWLHGCQFDPQPAEEEFHTLFG